MEGFVSILVVLPGLAVLIFWMVVGWRAMQAHEMLAESVAKWVRREAGKSTGANEKI